MPEKIKNILNGMGGVFLDISGQRRRRGHYTGFAGDRFRLAGDIRNVAADLRKTANRREAIVNNGK